ncbi:uncharacterized protein LOC114647315 [Erpetoichthys calabaricus]|uniref:uncharacterized protein LOC114647315 n=1 Tax=Erpetoichthys calabaricus TaxID=27687 RepID=UPI00109F625F|nr:uncharacterized protein LOC114647315 [Erpetoichthys calabaricus]
MVSTLPTRSTWVTNDSQFTTASMDHTFFTSTTYQSSTTTTKDTSLVIGLAVGIPISVIVVAAVVTTVIIITKRRRQNLPQAPKQSTDPESQDKDPARQEKQKPCNEYEMMGPRITQNTCYQEFQTDFDDLYENSDSIKKNMGQRRQAGGGHGAAGHRGVNPANGSTHRVAKQEEPIYEKYLPEYNYVYANQEAVNKFQRKPYQ